MQKYPRADGELMVMPDRVVEEMKVNAALRDRRIYFNEDVGRDSTFKTIYFMERIRDLDKQEGIKKPIELVISSPGGVIYDGLAVVSKIEEFKDAGYKIITTANSMAMSMAFILLICGSERRALRYSRLMLHQPSSATWGTLQGMKEDIEETDKLWEILKGIIKKYTKITDEQLEDMRRRKFDWYMSPQEAKELNIIDKII